MLLKLYGVFFSESLDQYSIYATRCTYFRSKTHRLHGCHRDNWKGPLSWKEDDNDTRKVSSSPVSGCIPDLTVGPDGVPLMERFRNTKSAINIYYREDRSQHPLAV